MFKIRGADGREYGPVDTGQLHQWIHEGRAGAQTQVQPVGTTTWSPLSVLPEFAGQFTAPPPATAGMSGAMPPVVRTIAFGFFVVGAIGALWQLMNIFTILRLAGQGSFHPGFPYYFSWGMSAVTLPVRIVSGIGLLRGREWARRLAVGCGIVLALYGVWGLVQTFMMFAQVSDPSFMFRSPMFLLSHVWSLAVLVFNVVTVVLLCRKDVRAVFSRKTLLAP